MNKKPTRIDRNGHQAECIPEFQSQRVTLVLRNEAIQS